MIISGMIAGWGESMTPNRGFYHFTGRVIDAPRQYDENKRFESDVLMSSPTVMRRAQGLIIRRHRYRAFLENGF
ncbi:hypothetical protein ED28_08060 [[Pantoea] beijingensis]|uniref:Uncharacterized protein n=1 Tax=[Pantoea] beijingensis TaxID=1324864 RepID=A0A443IE33_9GAMM|nr:hypothetical protein ED28_08060 [[Pantoea] beijingensis]